MLKQTRAELLTSLIDLTENIQHKFPSFTLNSSLKSKMGLVAVSFKMDWS